MPRYRVIYYNADNTERDREHFASKEYCIGLAIAYANIHCAPALVVDEETGRLYMVKRVNFCIACLIFLALAGLVMGTANANNSKENEKPAAGEVINSTDLAMSSDEHEPPQISRFDTTALDSWCGEPAGQIRMIGGWYHDKDTIETEDGNLWELNTEDINEYELLLIWFDDMDTPEIEDDQIIKVWSEVYD